MDIQYTAWSTLRFNTLRFRLSSLSYVFEVRSMLFTELGRKWQKDEV